MTGWILAGGKFSADVQRLLDNVSLGEHHFEIVNCSEVCYGIDHGLPAKIWLRGKAVSPPDFFLIADSEGGFVFPFAQQLERLGVFNYNSVAAKQIAISKIATYQVLAKEGLPIVKTLVFHKEMTKETLLQQIGLPMILKPDDGFGGTGVELVQSEAELDAALEKIKTSDALMLVQEYVATSKGRDLRVLTIDHEAVFASQRTASNPDEFRSNLKVGGNAKEYELTDEIRTLCHKVSKAVGLNMAGIDLLFGKNGFVVGEINSTAGFDSWLGKKDLFPLFLKSIREEMLRRPLPYWRFLELVQQAEQVQLGTLLLGLDNYFFYKAVHSLFAHCAKTQETLLLEMLQAAKDTEFGKAHGFAEIKSITQYRERVPLSSWEDYEDSVARLENAEGDILFPGKAVFFYRTSGTTAHYKYVPESERETIARKCISRARNAENYVLFTPAVAKKVFVFANKSSLATTKGGIPCGTASGRTGETIDPALKDALAYPLELANLFEGDDFIYMMLRCSLVQADITAVLGNNALMFKKIVEYGQNNADQLVEDIRTGACRFALPPALQGELDKVLAPNPVRAKELAKLAEDGKFTPKYYWHKLMVAGFWLGGSVGLYVDEVRPYLPETTRFMDVGYGASETKMNIPTQPDTPAGALSIFSGFFEFLPLDGGQPLLGHELKDGETYEIVITTYGGLYRYCLKDLVRVEGFTGDTPNIYFVSKLSDVANLAQEKIPGVLLSAAIREALAENGHTCVCVQIHPHAGEKRYVVCLELEDGNIDPASLAPQLEQALCQKLPQYQIYRSKMLTPLTIKLMKKNWAEDLLARYAKGHATAAQVKIPVVIDALPEEEWWL